MKDYGKENLMKKIIVTWLKDISSALKLYHEEYHKIYKVIKAENILLTKDNYIKIANFKTLQIFTKKVQATNKIKDYLNPE